MHRDAAYNIDESQGHAPLLKQRAKIGTTRCVSAALMDTATPRRRSSPRRERSACLMDCDTRASSPTLARQVQEAGRRRHFKIVNNTVRRRCGRSATPKPRQTRSLSYVLGQATLEGAPAINRQTLAKAVSRVRDPRPSKPRFPRRSSFAMRVATAHHRRTRPMETPQDRAGSAQRARVRPFATPRFSDSDSRRRRVCRVAPRPSEGAPALKPEHLPVFDCATVVERRGKRFIHYLGHLPMMAAASRSSREPSRRPSTCPTRSR